MHPAVGEAPLTNGSSTASELSNIQQSFLIDCRIMKRKQQIFLSYAHKNRSLKDEIVQHFSIVDKDLHINVWHDDVLRSGSFFGTEIEHAIRSSSHALILVSPEFMASTYIMEKEYPLLAELEAAGKISVFALSLKPVTMYANPHILSRSIDFFDSPLALLGHNDRSKALAGIVDKLVADCLDPPALPANSRSTQMMGTTTRFKAVVIDDKTARLLLRASFDESWFPEFKGDLNGLIQRVESHGFLYLLSASDSDIPDRIIVMDLSEKHRLFSNPLMSVILFRRGLQASLARWLKSLSVPAGWKPYYSKQNDRLTIYPASLRQSKRSRVHIRFYDEPMPISHVHYLSDEKVIELEDAPENLELVQSAQRFLLDAIIGTNTAEPKLKDSAGVISLDFPISGSFDTSLTYDDWLKILTKKQRVFVEAPIEGPMRVRGPAGTGKTLALIMKLMHEARSRKEEGDEPWKAIFLTHSDSTVEYAWSLLNSIDSETMLSVDDDGLVQLKFQTIYGFAKEMMLDGSSTLEPLSTDGQSGRAEQKRTLHEVMNEIYDDGEVYTSLMESVSTKLRNSFNAACNDQEHSLIYELMNEFASKIEGEGLDHKSTDDMLAYLDDAKRRKWLMPLDEKADRRLVWNIYKRYCESLDSRNVLSLDQIVADLHRELGSNRYRANREVLGFHAIFVDEAHLFSHVERSTLDRLLVKPAGEYERGPPIILAHDLKQSPNNRFTQMYEREHTQRWKAASAQNAKTHTFDEVHRYTPEISALVAVIDKQFPAFMIDEDWQHYIATSSKQSGPLPTHTSHLDLEGAVEYVSLEAAKASASSRFPKVAVLCMDERSFEIVGAQMQHNSVGTFVMVDERSSQSNLQYARNKFVLSMPEYVAGLQFEYVFILGAEANAQNSNSHSEFRKYLSNLYLAVTRAERAVHVASSDERGGHSDVIVSAMANGAMKEL